MKKTSITRTFVAGIAAALMTLTAASANAKETFVYGENQDTLIVSILNEDGKTLTPKWKYEYQYDSLGNRTGKKAYRWQMDSRTWKPAYLLTMASEDSLYIMDYAEWDETRRSFGRNRRQSVYCIGSDHTLLTWHTTSTLQEMTDNQLF